MLNGGYDPITTRLTLITASAYGSVYDEKLPYALIQFLKFIFSNID